MAKYAKGKASIGKGGTGVNKKRPHSQPNTIKKGGKPIKSTIKK